MSKPPTYARATPATRQEKEPWDRQLIYLQEHAPGAPIDPRFPDLGTDPRPWGAPSHLWPPADVVDFVTDQFKREIAKCPSDYYLNPDIRFSVISVCLAHFIWLGSKAGAEWLMGFYGVEELQPHHGYVYVYMDPKTNQVFELSKRNKINLRVFDRCERDLAAPVTDQQDELIDEMKKLLDSCRSPHAPESDPIQHATGGLYRWVSSKIRDWLMEPTVNVHYPFPKPERISGPMWARNVTRQDGTLRYLALTKVEEARGRVYRIEDDRGTVLWCGSRDVSHPPLTDVERSNDAPEEIIQAKYRCSTCGQIRCCVTETGTGHRMCQHCIGVQLQKDERPAFDNCLYIECKRCPDYLDSHDRLLQLINHLNRQVNTPVNRTR